MILSFWLKAALVTYSAIRSARAYRQRRKDQEEAEQARREAYSTPPQPRIVEGEPIPVVFGTVEIKAPAVVGVNSPVVIDEFGSTFAFSAPGQTQYIDDGDGHQQLFIHLAFCQGPIDEVVELRANDERLYGVTVMGDGTQNESDVVGSWDLLEHWKDTGDSAFGIDDYFDQDSEYDYEGPAPYKIGEDNGFPDVARNASTTFDFFEFQAGFSDQEVGVDIERNLAIDGEIPDFRGVFGISGGIIWPFGGSMGDISAVVRRRRVGSYDEELGDKLSSQHFIEGDTGAIGDEMNGVAVIEECIIDRQWGMGADPKWVSSSHFQYASSEGGGRELGVSALWSQRTDFGDFIGDILKQIDAGIYLEPTTGEHVIRLVRDDYSLDTMTQQAGDFTTKDIITIGPDEIQDLQETSVSTYDLVNEVDIIYPDRDAGRDRVVSEQDATDQLFRRPVSQEIRYPFAMDGGIAARLAARDLADLSTPLRMYDIEVPASVVEDLRPIDVFVLVYPRYGIEEMVCRVTGIVDSSPTDHTVTIEAIQDRFAFGDEVINPPEEIDRTPLLESPGPAEVYASEVPFWWEHERVRREVNPNSTPGSLADEIRGQGMLAAHTDQPAAISWDLVTQSGPEDRGRRFSVKAEVSYSAGYNERTIDSADFTFDIGDQSLDLRDGETHAFFEVDGVIVGLTDFTDDVPDTMEIGWFDTCPQWPPPDDDLDETHYLLLGYGGYDGPDFRFRRVVGIDPLRRGLAATAEMKALPRTQTGRLGDGIVASEDVSILLRLLRPYVPGNLSVDDSQDDPTTPPQESTGFLTFEWSTRDRLQRQVDQDNDDDFTPDSDHEWRISIWSLDDQYEKEHLLLDDEPWDHDNTGIGWANSQEGDAMDAAGEGQVLADRLLFEIESRYDVGTTTVESWDTNWYLFERV